jgi:hypothetical protein
MSTGTSDEKKNSRSKKKQVTSRPTPGMQQIHVELWDEPPRATQQEDDNDDSNASARAMSEIRTFDEYH